MWRAGRPGLPASPRSSSISASNGWFRAEFRRISPSPSACSAPGDINALMSRTRRTAVLIGSPNQSRIVTRARSMMTGLRCSRDFCELDITIAHGYNAPNPKARTAAFLALRVCQLADAAPQFRERHDFSACRVIRRAPACRAHVRILGAMAQQVVHQHERQHRLGDRHGPDADAGVVATGRD